MLKPASGSISQKRDPQVAESALFRAALALSAAVWTGKVPARCMLFRRWYSIAQRSSASDEVMATHEGSTIIIPGKRLRE